MIFWRKHGGILAVLAAVLVLAALGGNLLARQGKPFLRMEPKGAETPALDAVTVRGEFGNSTHCIDFQVENGTLTQKFSQKNVETWAGDDWIGVSYQYELRPEGKISRYYESVAETDGEGTESISFSRITECEKLRLFAGVMRVDYRDYRKYENLEMQVDTGILLDVKELNRQYQADFVLQQDQIYQRPAEEAEEVSWEEAEELFGEDLDQGPYQLVNRNGNTVSVLPNARREPVRVQDGEIWFFPPVPGYEGEIPLYRVTEWVKWPIWNHGLEAGAAEIMLRIPQEPDWEIQDFYLLEGEQLALAEVQENRVRVRLFSLKTGEELDRGNWELDAAEAVSFRSYVQKDGAVFCRFVPGGEWEHVEFYSDLMGFSVKDGKLVLTRVESLQESLPKGAAAMDGTLYLFRVTAENEQEPVYAEILARKADGSLETRRIRTPLLEDRRKERQISLHRYFTDVTIERGMEP